MNRLIQQLARNGHLTFKKKWLDLIIQVFGHEAPIENNNLAEVATCSVFDDDFYRLKKISLKHLAYRKLANPFKWIEFLLITPLELLAWSLQRSAAIINIKIDKLKKDDITRLLLFIPLFVLSLLVVPVNIATNLATGLIRRIISPARYIIRPAIELFKENKRAFFISLGL